MGLPTLEGSGENSVTQQHSVPHAQKIFTVLAYFHDNYDFIFKTICFLMVSTWASTNSFVGGGLPSSPRGNAPVPLSSGVCKHWFLELRGDAVQDFGSEMDSLSPMASMSPGALCL